MSQLEQQIHFILETDKLKSILRRTLLINKERRENSAEHSWQLALMALFLSEHANEPVDPMRVIKMVLIHDIVEIDAGDTYLYDETGNHDKATREQAAAERIFSLLPAAQSQELHELWQEFEARQTPEAKFAAALDRLAPLLLNYYSGGTAWIQHGIRQDMVIQKVKHIAEGSETLWQLAQGIINQATEAGYLTPPLEPVPSM